MQAAEIPAAILPGWLGEFCGAVAEATQTPPGMAVMTGLAAVAACVQGRFEVRPYGNDDGYREPLCLWTLTSLPPGSRKTAVVEAFTEPLMAVEKSRNDAMRSEIEQNRVTRAALEKRVDALIKKASAEDDENLRNAAITEIARLREEIPAEMSPLKLWCGNVTPERLQTLMVQQGGRIAVLTDEGGVLEIMAGMYSGGNVDLDVFLKGHAGSPLRVDRQSREAYLDSIVLTFGLCIQPDVVAQLAQGNKRRFRGAGLLARFLWCIPENTVGKRDVSKRGRVPEHVTAAYRDGIKRLLAITTEKPHVLSFDPEALASWLAFAQAVEDRQGEHGEFHHIVDWTSKLPGAVARIAGLFHLVQHFDGRREIDDATMNSALDLAELLIDHAKAAFGAIGDDPATGDAKAVLKWIIEKVGQAPAEHCPKFKQRDCHNQLQGRFRTLERLDTAMKVLQARHIVSEPKKRAGTGRPSVVYYVNPSIFKIPP
jgi:putative DNA primase/helicase